MEEIQCIIQNLKSELKRTVLGQDNIIELFVKDFSARVNNKQNNRFLGMYFLCGPTSSGKKTFIATISKVLCLQTKFYLMNDIFGEDAEEEEILKFFKDISHKVLVFTNIEDAHLKTQSKISFLISNPDNFHNFSNTLIFFTSSKGLALIKNNNFLSSFSTSSNDANYFINYLKTEKKATLDNRTEAFSTFFLNFIKKDLFLLIFKPLSSLLLTEIASQNLKIKLEEFSKNTGCKLILNELTKIADIVYLSTLPFNELSYIDKKIDQGILLQLFYEFGETKTKCNIITISVGNEAEQAYKRILEDRETFIFNILNENIQVQTEWSFKVIKNEYCYTLEKIITSKKSYKIPLQITDLDLKYSPYSFETVAGQKNAKKLLNDIIKLLKFPESLSKFNIPPLKGMVLYGPLGVGKSLLAEAFSNELNLPYVRLRGLELFDIDLIKAAYIKAVESAPCIVILDEIDTKGVINGVVSQVPASLFTPCFILDNIFTIATARILDDIPEDLIAPNAIDIMIEIPDLDKDARIYFIKKILEKPHEKNIDIEKVVAYMTGMNGYELQKIGNQSSFSAITQGSELINEQILVDQINKIKYGEKLEPQKIRNPKEEIAMTAYHEAGHAVLSLLLLPQIIIEQVTVAPRSETLGFVSYKDEDFITTATKDDILKNLCVLLAGRVVKVKKFGDKGIDSGDITDIGQATLEAYAAIANLGMDEELGYINVQFLSEDMSNIFLKDQIEKRVIHWIDMSKKETENLVEKYWDTINLVALKLIDQEMLSGEELSKIVHDYTNQHF